MSTGRLGFKKSVIAAVLLMTALLQTSFSEDSPPTITLGAVGNYSGVDIDSNNSIQQANLDAKRKWGLGASVSLDTPLGGGPLSLAIGVMYIRRKFELGNNTLRVERTVPTLFVPVEARFWAWNFLYVGGGVFGSARVGNQEDDLKSGNKSIFSFSSSQRDRFEYGFTGSVGLTFPVYERTGITLEGRYLCGMKNSAPDSTYDERIRDLAVTAGVRISL